MNKRCTKSSCRKTFSTLTYGGVCPFCGKVYPQLPGPIPRRPRLKMPMWIDGRRIVFRLDEIESFHREGQRVKGIKETRKEMARHGYMLGLRNAKDFYDNLYSTQKRMDTWRTITDPVTGRREIVPV